MPQMRFHACRIDVMNRELWLRQLGSMRTLWAETRMTSIFGPSRRLESVFRKDNTIRNGYIEYCGKSRLSGTEARGHLSSIDADNKTRWAIHGADRLREIRQRNAALKQQV